MAWRSFSLRLLVVVIVLLLLQLLRLPYITSFGALLCGVVVQLFLVGLIVEVALKRIPRTFVIIPIMAYGGYYLAYMIEGVEMARKSREMQKANPSNVLRFDPKTYSLVTADAYGLVLYYDLPVAYETGSGFESYSFFASPCDQLRDGFKRASSSLQVKEIFDAIQLLTAPVGDTSSAKGCLLQLPEKPPLKTIVVTSREDDGRPQEEREMEGGISEQFRDFSIEGKVIATYETASVWRLLAFPVFYVGCGGEPDYWLCTWGFFRTYQAIDTSPRGVGADVFDAPESIVLGIKKRPAAAFADTNEDLASFIRKIDNYVEGKIKSQIQKQMQ